MRIAGNTNIEAVPTTKHVVNTVESVRSSQGSKVSENYIAPIEQADTTQEIDNSEDTKVKVQEVVGKMNEMLEVNNNTSKFLYHEGLDRYYVTVVDRETDEIVKEIPPKKLLDAFYEMQKMLGMIVDEKI